MRNVRLASAVLVLAACTRREVPSANDSTPRSSQPPASRDGAIADGGTVGCEHPLQVETKIEGSWIHGEPTLIIRLADASVAPTEQREIARVALATPYFAAEVGVSDLCSDAGTQPDQIAVDCILTPGVIRRVVVRAQGDALEVRDGDRPPRPWRLAAREGACFELHGFEGRRQLELLRAAWGRDVPRPACEGTKPRPPITVRLAFSSTRSRERTPCRVGGPLQANGQLLIPSLGIRKDLGTLYQLCGVTNAIRYQDAEGIAFRTGDMSVDMRMAYRLGSRLYFLGEDDRLASVELPCGTTAKFEIEFPWSFGRLNEKVRSNY